MVWFRIPSQQSKDPFVRSDPLTVQNMLTQCDILHEITCNRRKCDNFNSNEKKFPKFTPLSTKLRIQLARRSQPEIKRASSATPLTVCIRRQNCCKDETGEKAKTFSEVGSILCEALNGAICSHCRRQVSEAPPRIQFPGGQSSPASAACVDVLDTRELLLSDRVLQIFPDLSREEVKLLLHTKEFHTQLFPSWDNTNFNQRIDQSDDLVSNKFCKTS